MYFALRDRKYLKILLEKRNICGIICVGYNCNALQFGLGESSLDHRRREEFPAIFTIVKVLEELMKELSVFIDESGDFGEITERPAYYLVTLLCVPSMALI